jgi:hypothetical protein
MSIPTTTYDAVFGTTMNIYCPIISTAIPNNNEIHKNGIYVYPKDTTNPYSFITPPSTYYDHSFNIEYTIKGGHVISKPYDYRVQCGLVGVTSSVIGNS